MKKHSPRREVRKKSLQILYAYELNSDGLESLIDGVFSDVEADSLKDFGRDLVMKVLANKKTFDEEIARRADNWELDRIGLIDKIILRMGMCELNFFPDIPPKVTINEAIEIAKIFSTSSSSKFINGILDKVLADLKKSGELKKEGRGLMNEKTSSDS